MMSFWLIFLVNGANAYQYFCQEEWTSASQEPCPVVSCSELYPSEEFVSCVFGRDCSVNPTCKDLTVCPGSVWKDELNYDCATYSQMGWCENGDVGPNWDSGWGPLEKNGKDFLDASQMCCECGGGTKRKTRIFPMGWHDKDNLSCYDYKTFGWCENGDVGPQWDAEWGSFELYIPTTDNPDFDVSAADACPACGSFNRRRRLRESTTNNINTTRIRVARPTHISINVKLKERRAAVL